MWGALSDERTGLSFIISAGPLQGSHPRLRVPWDSRLYFIVSDSRLPLSSPPTTCRVTVEIFDTVSTVCTDRTENTFSSNPYCFMFTDPLLRNGFFYCCVRMRCRGNVFNEQLPSDGRLLWVHYSGFRAAYRNIISYECWIGAKLAQSVSRLRGKTYFSSP
jgi:hypothetical protein